MKLSWKIVVLSLFVLFAAPTYSAKRVLDLQNLAENQIAAQEAIAQTLKQIEEYSTQLRQYESELKNSLAPAAYIWDQAQSTIGKLNQLTNTLDRYKNEYGDLEEYLEKYQDVNYYDDSPCFGVTGCSEYDRQVLEENKALASESVKRSNDALMQSLDLQQQNLEMDAAKLEELQQATEGADGHMAAIQTANQLASQQANQLLQIRSLIIAQQNALAASMQQQADIEAQHAAAAKQLRAGSLTKSPPVSWTVNGAQ